MPKIDQHHTIDITVEKFLNACSANELQEVDLLIQSNRYQAKMGRAVTAAFTVVKGELKTPIFPYRCSICELNQVDLDNGEDTCGHCLSTNLTA